MHPTLRHFTFLLAVWSAGAAEAGEPVTMLPKNGVWVRYRCLVRPEGQMPEYVRHVTVSSVGRETVNDQPCRWIELKYVGNAQDDKSTAIFKLLIPEKALLEDEQPIQRVVRAWGKYDEQESFELTPAVLNGGDPGAQFNLDTELLFFPGPLRRAKPLNRKVTVTFGNRELDINRGVSGKYVSQRKILNSDDKLGDETEYQLWFDPEVPIGFAHGRFSTVQTLTGAPDVKFTMELTAEHSGDQAKSAIDRQ
jgi:hypothetical protein